MQTLELPSSKPSEAGHTLPAMVKPSARRRNDSREIREYLNELSGGCVVDVRASGRFSVLSLRAALGPGARWCRL